MFNDSFRNVTCYIFSATLLRNFSIRQSNLDIEIIIFLYRSKSRLLFEIKITFYLY